MELRQLQYVVQIAAEKNFSRAAEKLHIAQPSLSQQLSKLEKEIGVRLFQRSTNSVQLTYAGQLFVEKAQKVLDLIEQMKQEMEDISQVRKGKLTIGSLPITGSHILPKVLPVFKQHYPEIEVVLIEETSSQLEMLTAQGVTDLTLLSLPIEEKTLDYRVLVEEEIWLAVPPNHRFALHGSNKPIALEQLRQEPFILLKKGQGFRQIALDLCKQAGFSPHIVFESSNIETIQSLVAADMGIAFVPRMVARNKQNSDSPHYLPIVGRPSRTLVIAHRKNRYLSKAADAFIQTMIELVADST